MEKQAYVNTCCFCHDQFMCDSEHLQVCMTCLRKSGLDLAIVEKEQEIKKDIMGGLEKFHLKTLSDLQESMDKWEVRRKKNARLLKLNLIWMIIWLIIILFTNFYPWKESKNQEPKESKEGTTLSITPTE